MSAESAEEVVERKRRGDFGEEAVLAGARETRAVLCEKEVEEHNLDHAVFRSWCPLYVNGRAESRGHVKKVQNEGEAPTIGVDCAHTPSEQETEEGKRTPIVVAKNDKTKIITARVMPSKGEESYAVETGRRFWH